jgi:hypothetical protein
MLYNSYLEGFDSRRLNSVDYKIAVTSECGSLLKIDNLIEVLFWKASF